MRVTIFNTLEICDKSLNKTPEGYLILEGIIARSGDQHYFRSELGLPQGVNDEMIVLSRPVDEVTDPLAIASFMTKPVTDDHPIVGHVDSSNSKAEMRGFIMDVEATKENRLKAIMLVTDKDLVLSIENGKRELSAGYSATLEFSDDGKSAVQRKIRGNHVAFVDKARCGRECRIFDSSTKPNQPQPSQQENTHMAKMKIKDVEIEISDSAVPMVQTLINDISELEKGNKVLADKVSTVEGKLDASTEKVAELEKAKISDADISEAAELMAELWAHAKLVDKDYDCKGKTPVVIRKELVVAKIGDAMKEKDDVYICARFDVLVDQAKEDGKDPLSASLRDAGHENNGEPADGGNNVTTLKDLAKATEAARLRKMDRHKKVSDNGKAAEK